MPPLTDTQQASDATNKGALAQTIKPLPEPAAAGTDPRDYPVNGAIPDAVKSLIAPKGYHVP